MGIMRILLDTGAQISLMDESVGKWIINKTRSNVRLRGAFGSNRSCGVYHGELPLFVLGTDNTQLCNSGSALATDVRATRFTSFRPTVDTVANLNSKLFAFDEYFMNGYDLHLQRRGWSGLVNEETGHYIPVFRDPANGMWYLYTYIGSVKDAERVAGKAAGWK